MSDAPTTLEARRVAARATLGMPQDGAQEVGALRPILRSHGLSAYPMVALGILGFVDIFQGNALAVMAPDMSNTLGISYGLIAFSVGLQYLATAVAPMPMAALVRTRGRLCFESAGFRFADADRDLLHDLSLELEPGETVAIVGATGSGKTTMAALPSRLFDVTSGRITLDGEDIRDVRLGSLRQQVATVFEDPVLFSMSVRENVLLGRPDASDADIEAALAVAQAGFVHELPWGLDTRIGEEGMSLSGGQRQRLALARAVVARPAVLVLDDPLSALDVHTEALVEQALASVLADTTALLVVHRPSTVALADRVALLENGTLVAVATHSELMALPSYARILSVEDAA